MSTHWAAITIRRTVRLRYRVRKNSISYLIDADALLCYRCTGALMGVKTLFDGHPPEQLEIRQHLAGAQDHAGQGFLGDGDGQSGFFANPPIQILEQRSAAGQYNPLIADIGAEFRGSALEDHADRIHNSVHTLGKRFANFAV